MTRKSDSIRRGLMVVTPITLLSRVIAALLGIVVIKILSPSDLGVFLGVQAVVLAGSGMTDLGLAQGYRMLVSRQPELRDKLLSPVIATQLTIIILYFWVTYWLLSNRPDTPPAAYLVVIGTLVLQLGSTADVDLKIRRRFWQSNLLTILGPVGLGAALLVSLLSENRLQGLAVGYALSSVCAAVLSVYLVRPGPLTRPSRIHLRLLKTGLPFLAGIAIYRLGQHWGLTYVLLRDGSEASGLLAVPTKVYQLALVLSATISSVTIPLFHRLARQRAYDSLRSAFDRLYGPLWLIVGTGAGVCILTPSIVLKIIATDDYAAVSSLLPLFGLSFLIRTMAIPAANLMESHGLLWRRVVGDCIATTSIVTITAIGLPLYGLVAVPVALLVGDFGTLIYYWVHDQSHGRLLPLRKNVLASVALLISIATALHFGDGDLDRGVIFIPCFGVALLAFKVIPLRGVLSDFGRSA